MREYFALAISSARAHPLRAALTALGTVLGVAMIVALVSLGQGMRDAVATQFGMLGADRIIVQAKSAFFAPPGTAAVAELEKKDAYVVRQSAGVKRVATRILKSARVEFKDTIDYVFMGSMPADRTGHQMIQEVFNFRVINGRLLHSDDSGVVVVGNGFSKEDNQFGSPLTPGANLVINDKRFEVVGVLDKLGQPQFDGIVLMPENDMRDLYDLPDEVSAIVAESSGDPQATAADITKDLRNFRNVKEGKEDFTVETAGQMYASFDRILSAVTAVLIGIAIISLVVSAVGIANTMYTTVVERTREIGVMKALGATNADVAFVFVLEAALTALAGGLVGLAVGLGLSFATEVVAKSILGTPLIQASVTWLLILGSLGIASVVGIIAGLLPALAAAKLSPAETLRYE